LTLPLLGQQAGSVQDKPALIEAKHQVPSESVDSQFLRSLTSGILEGERHRPRSRMQPPNSKHNPIGPTHSRAFHAWLNRLNNRFSPTGKGGGGRGAVELVGFEPKGLNAGGWKSRHPSKRNTRKRFAPMRRSQFVFL